MQPVHLAVVTEDELGMAFAERVILSSDRSFNITRRIITRGCDSIRLSIAKYKSASAVIPHIVLTDLDNSPCASALMKAWRVEARPPRMLLRIAVREVESWVLGDRHGFAEFAGTAANKVPQRPEQLVDPKQTLLNLVRASRNRRLLTELVPPAGSAASIGPRYNDRLCEFVRSAWNIDAAADACPSLARMRRRVSEFLG